jgi:glycosyltransferase involved in cell wall biosynthesis
MLTSNQVDFVADAIESVLRQNTTFRFELTVADDFSTDGTREIVTDYRHRYPELIQPILPDVNLGAHALWRKAIETARGEYLAFLDRDDYWISGAKLQTQVQLLEAHREHAMAFHDATFLADTGRRDRPGLPECREFGLVDLLSAHFIPTCSAVVRRAALDPALPSWVTRDGPGDWMTWAAAAESGSIAYVNRTIGVYRVHSDGTWPRLDRAAQINVELAAGRHLAQSLPRYAAVCDAGAAHRLVQLAVERSRLTYARASVVLGTPPPMGGTSTGASFRSSTTRAE